MFDLRGKFEEAEASKDVLLFQINEARDDALRVQEYLGVQVNEARDEALRAQEDLGVMRQLLNECRHAVSNDDDEENKELNITIVQRRGKSKAAEAGNVLYKRLRHKGGAKLEDETGPGLGISERRLKNLIGEHVQAIFEDGHASSERTRALIAGINEHASVKRLLDTEDTAARNARIVKSLKLYCDARRRTKAGTYDTQTHRELRTVAHAAAFGDATALDVNRACGLDRHFVQTATVRGGGPLRDERRDKLDKSVGRRFGTIRASVDSTRTPGTRQRTTNSTAKGSSATRTSSSFLTRRRARSGATRRRRRTTSHN